jgi:hypothetical protein
LIIAVLSYICLTISCGGWRVSLCFWGYTIVSEVNYSKMVQSKGFHNGTPTFALFIPCDKKVRLIVHHMTVYVFISRPFHG